MSYDLMVFKANAAPSNRTDFMEWYHLQTEWREQHDYNDPAVTTPALRSWLIEMMRFFPALSGPFANPDESGNGDYNIGREIIYTTFSWKDEAKAYHLAKELAKKHGVGFFNVSAHDGEIDFNHVV